ncbi:MAG: PAS domain S-box protein, partial [Desulfobacteraceae bacterium]|nr:PAS domain S-box protein [Desulfobacteraceae bacterium]
MAEKPSYAELEERVEALSKELEASRQREKALKASESYYRAFFRHGMDGVVVIDPETGRPLDFNDQVCRQLGYSRDEFARLRLLDIEAKETAEESKAHIEKIVRNGFDNFETLQRTKKDQIRQVHVSAQVIDIDGRQMYHCIWRDITTRKRAEEKLLREQLLMKTLLDSLPGIFYLYDYPALRLVRWNNNHESLLGFGPGEIKDRSILKWHLPEAKEAVLEAVDKVMKNGQNMMESSLLTKDGEAVPFLMTGVKVVLQRRPYMMGVGIDISERNRALEALRESEKKYRLIAENTADLISIMDMNLNFTYVSPASMRLRGFTVQEAMAQTLDQVLTPESMQTALAVFESEMLLEASGTADLDRTRILELEQYKKDGSTVWTEASFSFLRDEDGKPVEVLAVTRDISDRKQTETALQESEEKFRLTYSSSPDAVNINRLDDGLFVDVNEGFTRNIGYTREAVIGRTSLEINVWHNPADRQKLVQGLKEKGYYENLEAQFRRKDGSVLNGLMSARVISLKGVPHIISITRDITESKLMATKLQQIQKFEAIGTLAGGIAHDFNNLLMGIQGRASLISMDLEASHPHREQIDAIEEYIRSATNLTQQLLGLARGGKYEVKPVDMNKLVKASSAMFGRTKKEIRIHTKCQASPLVVEADRRQIEQV